MSSSRSSPCSPRLRGQMVVRNGFPVFSISSPSVLVSSSSWYVLFLFFLFPFSRSSIHTFFYSWFFFFFFFLLLKDVDNKNFTDATFVEWATNNAVKRTSELTALKNSLYPGSSSSSSSPSFSSPLTPRGSPSGVSSFLKREADEEGVTSEDDERFLFLPSESSSYGSLFSEKTSPTTTSSGASSEDNVSMRDDASYVLCRICERPIREDMIHEHTQHCVSVATSRSKAFYSNSAIRKRLNVAETEFHHHHSVINAVLRPTPSFIHPLFQALPSHLFCSVFSPFVSFSSFSTK
jgi:translation initiation factor 2 beta subunit (eIF-2beta)/eIF-5